MNKFMQKIVSMMSALAITASIITSAAAGYWVCTDVNNVRKTASVYSSILTSVPYGTKLADLNPLDLTSNWRKIRYNGKTGYMHNRFMAEFDEHKTELCVVSHTTDIYMDTDRKIVIDTLPLGNAVWMTGDAFKSSDGTWIAPVTYTTTKTFWGFVDVIDIGEGFPYLIKITKDTKFYKYSTGNGYYKTGKGSYWMLDKEDGRIAIAVKSNGKIVEMWVNKPDCEQVAMGLAVK